jgi:hypothetical protein
MKKQLLISFAIIIQTIGIIASPVEEEAQKKQKEAIAAKTNHIKPHFLGNHIELVAKGGVCGSVLIKLKTAQKQLEPAKSAFSMPLQAKPEPQSEVIYKEFNNKIYKCEAVIPGQKPAIFSPPAAPQPTPVVSIGGKELWLRSVLVYGSKDRKTIGAIRLPPEGFKARYDWAGPRAGSHYEIYCELRAPGSKDNEDKNATTANCADHISLESIDHNVGCVAGPAGPGGTYDGLNMNQG